MTATLLVVAGIAFALVVSPLLHLAMHRSLIRERYKATSAHCMNCGDAINRLQQMPLLAWACKKNVCGTCHARVWPDVPWFDAVLIVLCVVTALIVGAEIELPAYLIFVATLFAISVVDLRHFTIPNRLLYPAFFACFGLMFAAAIVNGLDNYLFALLAMAGSWMFFFVFWFFSPSGLGFGDVRLSAFNGFMAGYIAIGNAVLAVMLGLLLASIVGIFLMVFRIRGRKDPIPFGPFLALGAALGVLGPLAF